MTLHPYRLTHPVAPVPLVVDSPHSGSTYPPDFGFVCAAELVRQTEDYAVDELCEGAAGAGATFLRATFPRSYIDANRAEDDLDPAVVAGPWPTPLNPGERTLLGLGLVRRLCKTGVPLYAAPLEVGVIQRRIEHYYRPYHAALDGAIDQVMRGFGECYLINAHSMPGRPGDRRTVGRADFVLGDRLGTSCDPSFTRRVFHLLESLGFSVALNDPYKGVEIVRRHGRPQDGRHALQLEINRRLYMKEGSVEKHEGFGRLREALDAFFRLLAHDLMRERSLPMAAE